MASPSDRFAAKGQSGQLVRQIIARGFSFAEDVVYVGMGVLLAYSACAVLVGGGMALWKATAAGAPIDGVLGLLDRTLLALMLVELLYTVQISFREHALLPEPFLLVGLIAATRRILVVTAESTVGDMMAGERFRRGMIEIGLLTFMVLVLVASLLMLRKRPSLPKA